MNLLEFMVSIKYAGAKETEEEVKASVQTIAAEAEKVETAFDETANNIKTAFDEIADQGFFSTIIEELAKSADELEGLDFASIVKTGLSYVALGIMVTAENAKEAAKEFSEYRDSLVLTSGPIESMQGNLEILKERYSDLMAEMEASGGYGFNLKELDAVLYAIDEQKIANVQQAVRDLAMTYAEAERRIEGWFGPFQKAEEIQAKSLSEMAANIQSQIDYNTQYQRSLETLAEAGYGDLAAELQDLGKSGAGYLEALANAVESGDTEAITEIQTLLEQLSESQSSLATIMTTTSEDFNALIQTISEETDEPFQIVFEDNAADVANGVIEVIGTIPDEITKNINIVTNYKTTGKDVDSHNAQGLSYVPFDGYVASLHRGERIMTASENRAYSASGGITGIQVAQITVPISFELDGEVLARKTYSYTQQLSDYEGERMSG